MRAVAVLLVVLACSSVVSALALDDFNADSVSDLSLGAGIARLAEELPEELRELAVKDSQTCNYCQLALIVFSQQVANLTKMDQIEQALVAKCDSMHLPGILQSFCETLAKDFVWLAEKFGQIVNSPPYSPFAACTVFKLCEVDCCTTNTVPEQLHLAFTNDSSQMSITWVTLNTTATHTVQYGAVSAPGQVNLSQSAEGMMQTYAVAGWHGYVHKAVMTGLEPATLYSYRVGDDVGGWSQTYNFWTQAYWPEASRTAPTEEERRALAQSDPRKGWPGNPNENVLVFGVVGDMGVINSNATIAALNSMASNYAISQVLHVGDISYADFYEGQWDVYMRSIEPFAARMPYHVLPGNHECPYSFLAYKNRFFMPGMSTPYGRYNQIGNMFYSFNVGLVHFIGFSTESSIDTAWADPAGVSWLKEDLQTAVANRAAQPWIVFMTHRPLYCSITHSACTKEAAYLRQNLESLLVSAQVDLVITGHVHDYERTYAVNQGTVVSTDYVNPTAPVYLVNGASGNHEGLDNQWQAPPPAFSAYRASEFGFGLLTVPDAQHLQWQFLRDSDLTVQDQFTIVKK